MTKILLVEDEKPIREMVSFSLKREGFEVIEADTARKGLALVVSEQPDLGIVDWMLPDMSGLELIEELRQSDIYKTLPLLMLTARAQEDDKVRGLDSGADDYLTKPVSVKELNARIRALLRRTDRVKDEVLIIGDLTLDVAAQQLLIRNEAIKIGNTEFKLLKFFMSHPNRVHTRANLLDFVWGQNVYVEERTVDVHILRLRKILKPSKCDKMLQTVRGTGYRFTSSESA